jgi:hypothetical protein
VHIISKRYDDIWKLGNVLGHACVTVDMGALIFLDNISSQLNETPTTMHKYIKGMCDREN